MMDWRKISRAIMSWVLESTWGHIWRGLVPNGPSAIKKSSSVDRVSTSLDGRKLSRVHLVTVIP